MPKEYKALVKDLEAQIDYLVGYSGLGLHWKKEYYARQDFISAWMAEDTTPPETLDKVNRIMQKLYDLRADTRTEQAYLEMDNQPKPRLVPVYHYGQLEGYLSLEERNFPKLPIAKTIQL